MVLVLLVAALLRVRSVLTAVVVLGVLAGAGALWWAAPAQVQAQVVVAVGLVLLVGAWRHLGSVVGAPRRGTSDPEVLARLTRVPTVLWNLTFVLACLGASWVAGTTVLRAAGVLGA